MLSSVSIASIGVTTSENLSLYHYLSGGKVLRLVLPPEKTNFNCRKYHICSIYNSNLVALKEFTLNDIKKLIELWKINGIILEGNISFDLLNNKIVDMKNNLEVPIGIRTFNPVSNRYADFIIYDYFIDNPVSNSIDTIRFIKDKGSPWKEIQVYYDEPIFEKFMPIAKSAGESMVPIHVYLLNHRGGKLVKDFYEQIKELDPYVYIHVELYGEYNTYCPNCGKPVAFREKGVLLSLEVENGKCWNCKYLLPFYNIISKKSDKTFVRLTGGDNIWYDPRAVMMK
jgi:hypothetical protein